MTGIKTRRRRAAAQMVLLQARIPQEARDVVHEAADRSGVSIAYYVEALIERIVEENGTLPVIEGPRRQREELPIPAA